MKKLVTTLLIDSLPYCSGGICDAEAASWLVEVHNMTSFRQNVDYLMKEVTIGVIVLLDDFDPRDLCLAITEPTEKQIIVANLDSLGDNPTIQSLIPLCSVTVVPEAIAEASVKPFISLPTMIAERV